MSENRKIVKPWQATLMLVVGIAVIFYGLMILKVNNRIVLAADGVLDDRHGALEGAEIQQFVEPHGPPRRDVVDHNAGLNGIYVHDAASPSSFRIRAMRMYLP